jgi:hypothetical protein
MTSRVLVAFILALASPLPAEQPPEVTLTPRELRVRRLPAVLTDPLVARHLDTGLTTAFVIHLETQPRGAAKGEAQVRLRYDLWDEKYLTERLDARGDAPVPRLLDRPALADWWRTLELVVWKGTGVEPRALKAKVTLTVLPFSQAEQRDAQDWLLRSFRGAPETGAPYGPPGGSGGGPLRELYGAAIAASIDRRSLISFSWTVPVVAQSP